MFGMSEKMSNREWRKSGGNLPEFMRDFHDAKDLFKTIEEMYGRDKYYGVDWVSAQCYVVDRFLWFMALHGYTLQKTRKDVECSDIYQTLDEYREKRMKASAELLNAAMAEKSV